MGARSYEKSDCRAMYKASLRGLIANVMRIRKQWQNFLEASIRASGLSHNLPLGDERILIGFLFNKQLIMQKDISMSDLSELQASRRVTMKDNLVSLLVAKADLSQEKAQQVFDIVMQYIKDNPHQLTAYLRNGETSSEAGKTGNFFN
jgi:hypothetical protein